MNLIIVKLYQSYKRKKDINPEMQITGYVAFVLYFATFCIVLPVFEIVSMKFYEDNLKFNQTLFILGSLVICYFYYKKTFEILFKKGRMKRLEKRYSKTYLPNPLLYVFVVALPVLLLLLGPALTVYLTGGEMLGERVTGLFE